MLNKTKTLIDKYTNVLVVTGLLLVIVITLSGNLSFGKSKRTVKAAAPVVETGSSQFYSITSVGLAGNVSSPDSPATNAGFEWGLTTSYGNNTAGNYPNVVKNSLGSWTSTTNAYGVGVDSTGNVYVSQAGSNNIKKYNSNGGFLSQFGSAGGGNGQFNSPKAIAVDSSDNIYVADSGNNRIQKFNSAGVYQSQFGSAGSGNGQFNTPTGIALDNSGNVFVADTGNQRIQKFDSSGAYQSQFGSAGSGNGQFANPTNLAINSSGTIYISDNLNNRIQVFNSSGVYQSQFGSYPTLYSPNGIAINNAGYIYVADTGNNRIIIFNSQGQSESTIFPITNPPGLAFGSNDNLYITSFASSLVYKYQTYVYYDGLISTQLNGLSCGDTYHYRAYATNSDGTSYGEDQSFTIPCAIVGSFGAQPTTPNWSSVTFDGAVIDSLSPITARGFQWGTTTSYGNTIYDTGTPPFPVGEDYFLESNLFNCNTTYHWRAYATNTQGTYYSNDNEFNFSCMQINNYGADNTTDSSANLNGNISTSNGDVTARGFEYGLDTNYGTTITDPTPPPYSTLPLDYSLVASNLACNTTYHFRPYATNSHGTFYGDDDSFTTLGCTTVNTLPASGVGATSALLNGNVTETLSDIIGQGFQLGTSTSYGSNIAYTPSATNLAYKSQFGSSGPYGITVNPPGDVYVVDAFNNRVQKFDSSGNYLSQFGSSGSGDGQFNGPYGVAIDSGGNIYVTDLSNNRVQKFDSSGNYLSQFGSSGSGDGQFNGPIDVAIDATGNIYVTDTDNNRVQVFGPVPVYSTGPYSTQASGLTCGTTYHYRAYVTNAGGTYYGADQTFNTQGCPYVPSSTTPTAKVNPNPAPLIDLGIFTAIGRAAKLRQAPGGWLGYIYRFIQSLPHNLTILLPYLVLIFILVIALIYALEATRERILAILYTRKARHKASALTAEKGVLNNIRNSSKLMADQLSVQMKLLVTAGLLNKFEQSAVNDSTKQIVKQSEVTGWSETNSELAGRKSLHQGGWAKIGRGLIHPLLWAPILILAIVTAGLDLMYRNFGIAEISSADIRLQIAILALCSLILALVWSRLVYNRNTRQNASTELSRAILLMQANAGILAEAVEKNEMQMDEINSITKKLNRKDEAGAFIKVRDDLASFVKSLAIIQALNLQEAGLSASQSIAKSINEFIKANKQLIASRKIKINKNIQAGLKIGLATTLASELLETNLQNAISLADKNSAVSIDLRSNGNKIKLIVEYKGLALSKRMLHLLEGPLENYRALDAVGTALLVNKIIAESVGGLFDVASDSKYGTTVRIKLPKSNAKIDNFKPTNKEIDNPELAPFNGKAKPA